MQSSLSVVVPAEETSLVTLYEAKLALGVSTSTDETLNDLVEMIIDWSSAEIAATCNRTFAKETVIEVFREVDSTNRIFLSRYPVTNIDSIDEDGETLVVNVDYELDKNSGTLRRLGSTWFSPVTVVYTGGYDLPMESPKALRQAALLMTREAYYASTRGDATVRMVGHRDARIIYFDPNSKTGGGAVSAGSPARRSIGDLLKHFMRFWV